MTMPFQCDDKDTLVAFLYNEISADLGRQVAAHLRTCAACADEVDALRGVQRTLGEWQPPSTELDFAIVQKPATVLRPSRWAVPSLPRWARAVAAVLVLAVGAAIANLQVRYTSDGLTVTTGWMLSPPAQPPTRVGPATAEEWRPALMALESDLRRELQTLRSRPGEPQPATARVDSRPTDTEAVMRRVQALVSESERRQQQELATRMAQFGREVQSDLFRMNQGFRQLQGRTGLVEGNQRQMVDYLRRVSSQTQQVP